MTLRKVNTVYREDGIKSILLPTLKWIGSILGGLIVSVIGYLAISAYTAKEVRNNMINRIPLIERSVRVNDSVNTECHKGLNSNINSTSHKVDMLIIYFSVKDPEFNNIIKNNQ
jgi:hypothetical protein